MNQPNLQLDGLFQVQLPDDTAIKFAPLDADSPLHLKATAITVCGLPLVGDWRAMGSWRRHIESGGNCCKECGA